MVELFKEDSYDDVLNSKIFMIHDVWEDEVYDVVEKAKSLGIKEKDIDYDGDNQIIKVSYSPYSGMAFDRCANLYNWFINFKDWGREAEFNESVSLKEREYTKDEIYAFLDEIGGYNDYNGRIEDVMDEFGLSREDAEGYVWNHASGMEGTGLRDEYLYDEDEDEYDDEEIDESVLRKRFVNEKLDDGYLSSQSQKDLERINNWYNFLQHHLEQINKWCSGGPMVTSLEYSGMLYNLPRCIKACQYMQEYFESILEDIQIEE